MSSIWRCVSARSRAAAGSLVSRLLTAYARSYRPQLELADALETCSKLAQTLRAALARYEPEPLGTYRAAARAWYSSLLEYLALLVNGEWRRGAAARRAA